MADRVDLDEGTRLYERAIYIGNLDELERWHRWNVNRFPAMRNELAAHREAVTKVRAALAHLGRLASIAFECGDVDPAGAFTAAAASVAKAMEGLPE